MTAPRIVTAALDEAALRQTLADYRAYLIAVYLESETRVVLAPLADFLGPRITLPPVRWLAGRAFGPALEIRWTLDGTLFEAVALSESDTGPAASQPDTSSPPRWLESAWAARLDPQTRTRTVLLAGLNAASLPADHVLYNAQPQGGLWVETRIPRPLRYPLVDPLARRVALRCVDYLWRGLVVLTRLADFVPFSQP